MRLSPITMIVRPSAQLPAPMLSCVVPPRLASARWHAGRAGRANLAERAGRAALAALAASCAMGFTTPAFADELPAPFFEVPGEKQRIPELTAQAQKALAKGHLAEAAAAYEAVWDIARSFETA